MILRGNTAGGLAGKRGSGGHGWQLVLADLALILFLVTLTGLANENGDDADRAANGQSHVAPAQALFRPSPSGPSLPEWLDEQPLDPRTTLTIMAQYEAADRDLMWQNAQMMAASVASAKVAVRVIIRKGEQSDLYASLAYDEP